jgi:hypothetical protein
VCRAERSGQQQAGRRNECRNEPHARLPVMMSYFPPA